MFGYILSEDSLFNIIYGDLLDVEDFLFRLCRPNVHVHIQM